MQSGAVNKNKYNNTRVITIIITTTKINNNNKNRVLYHRQNRNAV